MLLGKNSLILVVKHNLITILCKVELLNGWVHVGLAEWIEHPLLMLEVRGSNPAPSENTTSLPRSPRSSPRSRVHRQISELSEGGGVIKIKIGWLEKRNSFQLL